MSLSLRYIEFLRQTTREIQEAQRPVRILRALAWSESVQQEFFARGADVLPRPSYADGFDRDAALMRFAAIRSRITGENEIERFLRDTCDSYEVAACMLGARGTRAFHGYSLELYGQPSSVSCDGRTTNLALAHHFDGVITRYAAKDLGYGTREAGLISAEEAARELERRFRAFFGAHPIRVELDSEIAANAVAGADVVRIKRSARFSERDLLQLEYHEGHVHVATTLNGRSQPIFSFLGSGAPRTTNTQEGLAIFTEFISQVMDLERVRRLTDRILAIHMSENGADFLDLYRFFMDHGHTETQAFDCARRVVRGGLVEGGAPFTKDVCYLDGLLKVSNFLRIAIMRGHPEFVRLLFVGKLDLDDIPLIARLFRDGLIETPRYLPRWARDLPFLTAYMSYSAFLNQTDLPAERRYYDVMIERAEADWPEGMEAGEGWVKEGVG